MEIFQKYKRNQLGIIGEHPIFVAVMQNELLWKDSIL